MRYTKADIVRITGITHRQFDRWRNRGLIPFAEGTTSNAYYTESHLERVRAIVVAIVDGRTTLSDLEERFQYEANPDMLDEGNWT